MKGKMVGVLFCILLAGCKTPHQKIYSKQMHESYLYDFKMAYFKRLLLEAFNRTDEIKRVLLLDRSGYGEQILSAGDLKLIDSLAKIDNKIMVRDSLNTIGTVGEGAQGKHVFAYAIGKFQSKWLDSLAKVRYKLVKKHLTTN